jgi:hypothetical protein
MKKQALKTAAEDILTAGNNYSASAMTKAEDVEREAATLAAEEAGEEPPMGDTEFQSIVANEITDAISYIDTDLSPYRAQATSYYRGDLFGNEQEGQSQVVATEVRDTVNSMLPSIMRVFFSSERTVEYVPRSQEDVPAAEQATDYANYILNQDNAGFTVLYGTFKDSLVRKCGIVKTWWAKNTTVRVEKYTGLDDGTRMMIEQEPDSFVTVIKEYDDPEFGEPQQMVDPMTGAVMLMPAPKLYDIEVKRVISEGRVCIEGVPPEEFLIDRNARSIDTAAFVGHRKMATVAELVAMGYDEDEVSEYTTSVDFQNNEEYLRRRPTTTTIGSMNESMNPFMQRVLYIEGFMRIDYDGDGIPELRKICCIGEGNTILRNEPADMVGFADFPFDPEPHTSPLEANSVYDYAKDLQEIKSDILRNTLDSLAQSIHPRTAVVEGQVNMDDVLNNETGAVIRMRAPGMVQALSTPFVGQAAFPMLEYMDGIKEDRTGMSRASMGLNADALQSSTKAAVSATISASQSRLELTTRILAEGMKKLFKQILQLTVANQDKARMVRLRNTWVQVDPRAWDATMDVSINVGLGNGDTEQKMSMLAMIAGKQEQALQLMGPQNPLVSPAQYANTLRKMVELSGFKDSSQFFNAIPADYQPPAPQPKPSPEEMLAQVQVKSIEADIEKKAADLALQREEMLLKDDRERDKLASEQFIKLRELELKYNAQINETQINAEIQRDRNAQEQMNMQMQAQTGMPPQ